MNEHIWNHRGEEGRQRLKRVSELRRKEREAPVEYETFLSKNDQTDSKEYRYSPPPDIQPYVGGVEEDELDPPANEEMLQWQLGSDLSPERSSKSSPLDAGFLPRKINANDPVIRFLFGKSLHKRRKRHAAGQRGQHRHRFRHRRQLLDMDVFPRNRRFRFLPWPRKGIFHKMAKPFQHGYAG